MKKLIAIALLLGTSAFAHAQNEDFVTAQTKHFPTKGGSTPIGTIDIAPHASTLIPGYSCASTNYAGDALVSFFNEENGSTWMTVTNADGNIISSTELHINSGNTFHITAATLIPTRINTVAFTGTTYNPNVGSNTLMAGIVDVCNPSFTNLNLAMSEVSDSKGSQILINPSNGNEFIIVGSTNQNGSPNGNELLVAVFNYTMNSFNQLKHHNISFEADDAVYSFSSVDNLVISGISDYSASPVNGYCNDTGVDDRAATLIEYDFANMEIIDMKSYSGFWMWDQINNTPIANDRTYFMLEASTATNEYIGTTAVYDRISNTENEKNFASALLTFTSNLNIIDMQQLFYLDGHELKDANLIYTGGGLLGVSMYTFDNRAQLAEPKGIITMPVDVYNPFLPSLSKRVSQNTGVLGISNMAYGNRATTQGFGPALFSSVATLNHPMQVTGYNYIHTSEVNLNTDISECFEEVTIGFLTLCADEMTTQLGEDNSGTSFTIVYTSEYFNKSVVGDLEYCSGPTGTFKTLSSTVPVSNAPAMELMVSPNPVNTMLNLSIQAEKSDFPTQVQVLDVTGRTLSTQRFNANQIQLNVAELPSGVYFLQVQRNADVVNYKFVKE